MIIEKNHHGKYISYDDQEACEKYKNFYKNESDNFKLPVAEQVEKLAELGIGYDELNIIDFMLENPYSLLHKNINRLVRYIERNNLI